jgi:DNA-binding response OmpR family regulator
MGAWEDSHRRGIVCANCSHIFEGFSFDFDYWAMRIAMILRWPFSPATILAVLIFRLIPPLRMLSQDENSVFHGLLPWEQVRAIASDLELMWPGPSRRAANTCPSCYYTSYTRSLESKVLRPTKKYSKEEITTGIYVARFEEDPTIRWWLLGRCLSLQGVSSYELGWCFLRGSLTVRDPWARNQSDADSLQDAGLVHFKAFAAEQSAPKKQRGVAMYLCGEILRQSGKFSEAIEWFEKHKLFAKQSGSHHFRGINVAVLSRHQMRLAMEEIPERIKAPNLRAFKKSGRVGELTIDEIRSRKANTKISPQSEEAEPEMPLLEATRKPSLVGVSSVETGSSLTAVFVRGQRERGRNVIKIGGRKATLGDRPFELLLNLVARHVTDPEELLPTGDLADCCHLAADTVYQAVQRLRSGLESAMSREHTKSFIENIEGEGYRISPRAYITYDKRTLLKHPNGTIRQLAEKLPDPARTPEALSNDI